MCIQMIWKLPIIFPLWYSLRNCLFRIFLRYTQTICKFQSSGLFTSWLLHSKQIHINFNQFTHIMPNLLCSSFRKYQSLNMHALNLKNQQYNIYCHSDFASFQFNILLHYLNNYFDIYTACLQLYCFVCSSFINVANNV